MKKIILLALVACPALMAMEPVTDQKQEVVIVTNWNAGLYKKNNWVQRQSADIILHEFNQEFNFDIVDQEVLDMGCGTGETSVKMAEIATRVLAMDASLEMVRNAHDEYCQNDKVTFIRCAAQDLDWKKKCTRVTSFFCLHWVKDKQTVFTNFYNVLKPGGKMLCTLATEEEKALDAMKAVGTFLTQVKEQYPCLKDKSPQELLGRYRITTSSLENMLKRCGFKSIVIKPKCLKFTFTCREEYAAWQWPIFKSLAFVELIPQADHQLVFDQAMDQEWESFEKNEQGHALFNFITTVVTAEKPA